jgi:hypothetical protein
MLWALKARAEHATIDLRIISPNDEKAAIADQEPPLGGVIPRPLMKVRAGDPLVLQFILENIYPHGELKDVTVRYFIVRAEKAGQKEVPSLKNGVVTEGSFTLHFKPKCRVGARLQLTAPDPGIYLVRVDTVNTKSDHEHFAAMDLQVE